MDPKLVTPIILVAVFAWAIYRRVRRTIGRQRFEPTRMQIRMVILSLVGLGVLVYSGRNVELIGAMIAGVAGGATLGYFGLRYTKFETTREGQFYTPHLYIGLFVSVLFLGRLAYRFVAIYPEMQAAHQADQNPFATYQKSPLTLAIFGVVIGYYVVYFAGVLKVCRSMMVKEANKTVGL